METNAFYRPFNAQNYHLYTRFANIDYCMSVAMSLPMAFFVDAAVCKRRFQNLCQTKCPIPPMNIFLNFSDTEDCPKIINSKLPTFISSNRERDGEYMTQVKLYNDYDEDIITVKYYFRYSST